MVEEGGEAVVGVGGWGVRTWGRGAQSEIQLREKVECMSIGEDEIHKRNDTE